METEFIRIISAIPFDMYKSRYYVSNTMDVYRNMWKIYYRKSKNYKYVIRVQKWNNVVIEIDIDTDSYPVRIEHIPKYLIRIITKIANYLSILGFPTKVYGL